MYIYFDPITTRIAYCTQSLESPGKVLIVDGDRLILFTGASLTKAHHSGEAPEGIFVQNCWNYSYVAGEIKPWQEG